MVAKAFVTLPWVTSVSDIDNHENRRELVFELPPKSSNVTSLTFQRSGVSIKSLNELLGGFKVLKTFSFLAPDETIADYDPSFIRATLLAHADYTLETFILEADGTGRRDTHDD